ncbi:hypothetical protein L6164_032048 [Bauhinia variegata]|uniref:Uncharacterized protein n=1 Tax=Bauhinia variegata TaxID=167791 RepID=A0ACB9KML2_BAUVA|nr:hypothetical protein L6164_032048 [Bauhinia variegata]
MGKTSTKPESKSNRKFEKKLEFYAKVKNAVTSLSAQKTIHKKNKRQRSRQKKLKAYDLSSVSDFLPELKTPRQAAPQDDFKLSCKSRQKLIFKEGKQLLQVLNHPAFQSDPLSAIHQHLQNTQPVVEEQEQPKKKVNKNGSKKKKEKKPKASVGPESMNM